MAQPKSGRRRYAPQPVTVLADKELEVTYQIVKEQIGNKPFSTQNLRLASPDEKIPSGHRPDEPARSRMRLPIIIRIRGQVSTAGKPAKFSCFLLTEDCHATAGFAAVSPVPAPAAGGGNSKLLTILWPNWFSANPINVS